MSAENIFDCDNSFELEAPECLNGNKSSIVFIKHLAEWVKDVDDAQHCLILNFQQTRWFELFELAQVISLTLLVQKKRDVAIKVVLPCMFKLEKGLRYAHQTAMEKFDDGEIDGRALERTIHLHETANPRRRLRAGSFLVSWGVIDLLTDEVNAEFYLTDEDNARRDPRVVRNVKCEEVKKHYPIRFGQSGSKVFYKDSDSRVWPMDLICSENEQWSLIKRLNTDELFLGAAHKYTNIQFLYDGTMSNVLFFEPLENVFQHAYAKEESPVLAVIGMRILDSTKYLEAVSNKSTGTPVWFQEYLKNNNGSCLEILVSDAGDGIAGTLEDAFDVMCPKEGKKILRPSAGKRLEIIKYAIEKESSSKREDVPGIRGLGWLAYEIERLKGLIQIQSNGERYVAIGDGKKIIPVEKPMPSAPHGSPKEGCSVRLLLPLSNDSITKRKPKVLPQFTMERRFEGRFLHKPIDGNRSTPLNPNMDEIDRLLDGFASDAEDSDGIIICVEFLGERTSRAFIECFFLGLLEREKLRGRIIIINCYKYLSCRMDTLEVIHELKKQLWVVPVFERSFSIKFLGVIDKDEDSMIRFFSSEGGFLELMGYAQKNNGLFLNHDTMFAKFRFTVADVEKFCRNCIGDRLLEALDSQGLIHKGWFKLPHIERATSLHIEPHTLFEQKQLSEDALHHIGTLILMAYGDLFTKGKKGKILTATDIGGDISNRLPRMFERERFAFFDYHTVKGERTNFSKRLRDCETIIVTDVISTGQHVEDLLKVATSNNCKVVGVVTIANLYSDVPERNFLDETQKEVPFFSFIDLKQKFRDLHGDERLIDERTYALVDSDDASTRDPIITPVRSKWDGLNFLQEAEALHIGHFEMFGHHYEYISNMRTLFEGDTPHVMDILRSCENQICAEQISIVLYPSLSSVYLLVDVLRNRRKIKERIHAGNLKFVRARRGNDPRCKPYWLSPVEIEKLKDSLCGQVATPSVLVLDDGATTGGSLISLLQLAKKFDPLHVFGRVVVDRMPYQHSKHYADINQYGASLCSFTFTSYLHLNIPVYNRYNCPICRERDELIASKKKAGQLWFTDAIKNKIDRLAISSSLGEKQEREHDLRQVLGISDEEIKKRPRGHAFSWEKDFSGQSLAQGVYGGSILDRATSVAVAINDGIPLLDVLKEISKEHVPDEVYALGVAKICHRRDLYQNSYIADKLVERLMGWMKIDSLARRRAAIRALRIIPDEILDKYKVDILNCFEECFEIPHDDDILSEIVLIVRKVLGDKLAGDFTSIDSVPVGLEWLLHRTDASSRRFKAMQKVRSELASPRDSENLYKPIEQAVDILNCYHQRAPHRLINRFMTEMHFDTIPYDKPLQISCLNNLFSAGLSLKFVADTIGATADTAEMLDAFCQKVGDLSLTIKSIGADVCTEDRIQIWDRARHLHDKYIEIEEMFLKTKVVDMQRLVAQVFDGQPGVQIEDKLEGFADYLVVCDREEIQDLLSNLSRNIQEHLVLDEDRNLACVRLSRDNAGYIMLEIISLGSRVPPKQDKSISLKVSAKKCKKWGVDHDYPTKCDINEKEPWHEQWKFRKVRNIDD